MEKKNRNHQNISSWCFETLKRDFFWPKNKLRIIIIKENTRVKNKNNNK